MAESGAGALHSINVSAGGVPKLARAAAAVRRGGVEGDRQRDLEHHGGPLRAVSLYSLERIEALRAGWSRLYARVLAEGTVRIGDPVRFL